MGDALYSYEQVLKAYNTTVELFVTFPKEYGPDYVRVLRLYMFTPLSRTMIADLLDFDPSTVKRKLDAAADFILEELALTKGIERCRQPKPETVRDRTLKLLRKGYPRKEDLEVDDVVYDYANVRAAIDCLSNNGPDCVRVLRLFISTPESRAAIARHLSFDPSTVRRKLEVSVNMIMQYLNHYDFEDDPLFAATDPNTGKALIRGGAQVRLALPITFPHANRSNF